MNRFACLACLAIAVSSRISVAYPQDIPGLESAAAQEAKAASTVEPGTAPSLQHDSRSITVSSGTHVLMVLTSPLHSTSGVGGAGIYLETIQPVIQDNRIVIPAHTRVQGIVEANKRPGHFRRTAEFKFHFTTLIFPNNHVAAISGVPQSIPGSGNVRIEQKDGKLKTVDQHDRVIVTAIAAATGGTLLGSVSGFGVGKFTGGGLGAGLGLEGMLLQKGDNIELRSGTPMEMVLDNQFVIDAEQADFNSAYVPPPGSRIHDVWQQDRRTVRRSRIGSGPFPHVTPWY